MNMCSTMNSRRRARYGYKPFLTSTFAFIYYFMIQKALKFIVKDIFGRNSSPKVFLDGQSRHKFLPRRPQLATGNLRWLDWIFLGGYLPSLSIDHVAMSKDREKRLPQLHYIKMKISYDLGFIAIGVAMAT